MGAATAIMATPFPGVGAAAPFVAKGIMKEADSVTQRQYTIDFLKRSPEWVERYGITGEEFNLYSKFKQDQLINRELDRRKTISQKMESSSNAEVMEIP